MNNEHLIRSELWSKELKQMLLTLSLFEEEMLTPIVDTCLKLAQEHQLTLSITETVVLGTAAIIAENPEVTRRFWKK